jgi:hypothetical protein
MHEGVTLDLALLDLEAFPFAGLAGRGPIQTLV